MIIYVLKKLKNLKVFLLLLVITITTIYCGNDSRDKITKRVETRRKETFDTIRTIESEEYFGEYHSSDYKDETCNDLKNTNDDDYRNCKDICKKIYHNEDHQCKRISIELISKIDNLYEEITRLASKNPFRSINNFDFGVMIDIDTQSAIRLIKYWSEREVTQFLLWVASTTSISLALNEHDNKQEILEIAFKKIADNSKAEEGIQKNLDREGDTFWVIAEQKDNKSGFIVMHNLVKSICSNNDCKKAIYCFREVYSRNERRNKRCKYSNKNSRRTDNYCYIHGPNVWNKFEELKQEGKIRDSDFSINKKICDDFCDSSTHNCE